MEVLILAFCIYGISVLIRAYGEVRQEQRRVNQKLQEHEVKQINIEVNLEKQAKEIAKHEEQIAKLERQASIAVEEVEFQAEQIRRHRKHLEMAELERDACAYGSSNYLKWDKKCLTIEKQIHTAESKMSAAQFSHEQAEKKLGVA